jgi:hypothetical protein
VSFADLGSGEARGIAANIFPSGYFQRTDLTRYNALS